MNTSCIGIGLLGCGTVGGGVADLLLNGGSHIAAEGMAPFALRSIAVRSLGKLRPAFIPKGFFTRDAAAVIDDPENDVIVECVGGVDHAGGFVERALRRGKHVVTANKDLIATEGPRLHALAARAGVLLQYEASVGGAIPIVRTISEALASEDIFEVAGVLNGTTNFILTRMHDGASYSAALAEAHRCGYAESNPFSDVSGLDAAHKLAILSQLAFRRAITSDRIERLGIHGIRQGDLDFARSLGYTIKLLGIARNTREGYRASVTPAYVEQTHAFAAPQGADNCIRVLGRSSGSLLFSGAGAGREPTASAVISDVMAALRALVFGPLSAVRALTPVAEIESAGAELGRFVRFDSFRDARPGQTILEQHGYRTRLIDHRAALHLAPRAPLRDAEILRALALAEIVPTTILPVWQDAHHPQAPVTDTFRTHRREKETIS